MTDRPDRPKRESMSPEEATISNMWEIAAIVEVLERKGVCTKQDLLGIITELRKTNPRGLHVHTSLDRKQESGNGGGGQTAS